MGHDCGRPLYGAVVERGKVITIDENGYIINSLDRDGIQTPSLQVFGNAEYNIGDLVYFFLFRDGTGGIIGG